MGATSALPAGRNARNACFATCANTAARPGMFDPSREQARDFFFGTWRKYREGEPLVGLEAVALDVILAHPEYHGALADPARLRDKEYFPELGEPNPFLHLSMHLAIEEQ